jgi:hypothetical protein
MEKVLTALGSVLVEVETTNLIKIIIIIIIIQPKTMEEWETIIRIKISIMSIGMEVVGIKLNKRMRTLPMFYGEIVVVND